MGAGRRLELQAAGSGEEIVGLVQMVGAGSAAKRCLGIPSLGHGVLPFSGLGVAMDIVLSESLFYEISALEIAD